MTNNQNTEASDEVEPEAEEAATPTRQPVNPDRQPINPDIWRNLLCAAGLIVLAVIVYGRSVGYDFIMYDDDIHVFANWHLKQTFPANYTWFWLHQYKGLFIPISYNVYGLLLGAAAMPQLNDRITEIGGLYNPHYFHAANIAIHALNTALVFCLLLRLTRSRVGSLIGGALFCLHPLQVESVAWISELRGLLSAAFFLMCALAYFQAAKATSARWAWYSLSVVLALCAMLCKPVAAAAPLALFALDYFIERRSLRDCLLAAAPIAVEAVAILFATRSIQPVHAVGIVAMWQRPLIALDTIAFYVGKLFYPLNLSVDYGRTPTQVAHHKWFYATAVPAIAFMCVVVAAGRRWRWVFGASLFSLAFLIPVLGFVPFSFQEISTVADRYMYITLIGACVALAIIVRDARRPAMAMAALVVALATLTVINVPQLNFWRNSLPLATRALAVNPTSFFGLNALGATYIIHHQYAEAYAYLIRSYSLSKDKPYAAINLGRLSYLEGDYPSAIKWAYQANQIDSGTYLSWQIVGESYYKMGDYADAIPLLARSEVLEPGNMQTLIELADCNTKIGRYRDAIAIYAFMLKKSPRLVPAYAGLGDCFMAAGDAKTAIRCYNSALLIAPTNASLHVSRANALTKMGLKDAAAAEMRRAKELNPALP